MTEMLSAARNRRPAVPQGFSLTELMIALAAGLVVSTAVVAFLMSSFRSNSDYVSSTRLTQELRNTLDVVSRDLRRAGYDEEALSGMSTGRVSPFSRVQFCDISGACPGTAPETCAIYAYDRNGGTQGVLNADNGEVRGVRRRQMTNINGVSVGVIEYATSAGAKPTCNGAGPVYTAFSTNCTTLWCPLTDPSKLDITTFTLTDGGANTGGVKLRDITIVMRGRPAGSSGYIRGVKTSVRIRSDCYDSSLANCNLGP